MAHTMSVMGWPPSTGPGGRGRVRSSALAERRKAMALAYAAASTWRAAASEVTALRALACFSKSRSKPSGRDAPSMNQSRVCAVCATLLRDGHHTFLGTERGVGFLEDPGRAREEVLAGEQLVGVVVGLGFWAHGRQYTRRRIKREEFYGATGGNCNFGISASFVEFFDTNSRFFGVLFPQLPLTAVYAVVSCAGERAEGKIGRASCREILQI